jgi:hypothetical protein
MVSSAVLTGLLSYRKRRGIQAFLIGTETEILPPRFETFRQKSFPPEMSKRLGDAERGKERLTFP